MSWRANRAYLAVRKFVDWDLDNNYRLSIALAFLSLAPAIVAERYGLKGGIIYWPISGLLFFAAIVFIGWRFARMGARYTMASDQKYDRETKHLLPPEYADSMSAAEARRRRKRRKIKG